MSTYYVYHCIHVRTPIQYIPKLFVTGVPDDSVVDWDLVDEYNEFGEFNIPHANHGIKMLSKDSPAGVKRAWRNGEVERVTFSELQILRESF